MKADIWMPLFVADYLADTNRLTTVQHGAYLLLIMDYWRNGALPDDDAILAQVTRMSPDAWSIAKATIQAFFQIENGKWTHRRIELEMEKAGCNKKTAHDKAVKAAEARWGKVKNAPSMPQALDQGKLVQCPSPSPSPTEKRKKKESEKTLSEFLDVCKEIGEMAIREDDPIFEWAETVSLPRDMLHLGWAEFKNIQAADKKQADWRATFRNYVKKDYLKVWALNREGEYYLTLRGKQLERELNGASA